MAGYRVKYTLATRLFNELVEAAEEMILSKTIARYGRVDLLLIDELGYMALDKKGAELLFQVLTEREETNSIATASNASFSEWTNTMTRHGKEKAAGPGGLSLGGWAAGHELAAGVLVQAVEQPAGEGEGVVIGAAGQGQAADQDVQARGGGGVEAVVGQVSFVDNASDLLQCWVCVQAE